MRWRSLLLCAMIVVAGCSESSVAEEPAPTTTEPVASIWDDCGRVMCATFEVPVDHDAPDGDRFDLAVYASEPPESGIDPVILVADPHYGDGPRQVVENAAAHLGREWLSRPLISIDIRGSEASPLPLESESNVSFRDVARDVEFVRRELDLDAVSAIGWGRGASALAVLAAETPEVVSRVVLDSPTDPLMPPVERTETQIAADTEMVDHALNWCVSHISCPMGSNAARGFNLLKTNMRIGIVDPEVSMAIVGQAAREAFADGDPQAFFNAVDRATNGDSTDVLALAADRRRTWESGMLCSEVTDEEAATVSGLWGAVLVDQSALFVMGDAHDVYAQCPLGASSLDSEQVVGAGAEAAEVLVIAAEHDPVTAAALSKSLATRLGWQMLEVPVWRHLVVGFDAEATARAWEFLNP